MIKAHDSRRDEVASFKMKNLGQMVTLCKSMKQNWNFRTCSILQSLLFVYFAPLYEE